MTQKTILFDIGNVLIGVDFPPFFQKVFGTLDLDADTMARFIELRDLGDTGGMTKTDFIREVCDLSGQRVTEGEVIGAWNGIFSPIPAMWDVVNLLKKAGHRLILFSNTNDLHLDHLRPSYPILEEFSEGHFSCEEGCLKPDPEFFEKAVTRFGLVAGETLYFDDRAENIEVGTRFGFCGYQYDPKNHGAALKWLEGDLG